MEIEVTQIVRDEGSIVLFQGTSLEDGRVVTFAADHRPAQELINGMLNDEEIIAFVEPWQVVGA
jgi:hypothetical protein